MSLCQQDRIKYTGIKNCLLFIFNEICKKRKRQQEKYHARHRQRM